MIRLYRATFNIQRHPVFYRLSGAGILEFYNPYARKWVLSSLDPEVALWAYTLVGVNVKFKV
ncbi:hypothetical protein 6995_0007 [Klebsiella phage 6995]|uniref:Uncharacterized protein n=1 Tax=Klebsiella phage 6995 TaxID=2912298 RepID=A0A9E7M8B2_9CAUD|nr:hypothetical protein 6995_0007 [Klebsiella phage 6995]